MSIRTVCILAAVLCALPLSGAAAQQASDSVKVPVPALTESVNVPANPVPAPASLVLLREEPLPTFRFNLASVPALAAPPAAGQHTFVVSTLALVLGIILLVVLID
jgi:hypothetical protein